MLQTLVSFLCLGAVVVGSVHAEEVSPTWAIALHGGASSLPPDMPGDKQAAYRDALTAALRIGVTVLEEGGSALDATQRTVMSLEDCPLFNAGRGSVFDRAGGHAMDASIMDGRTLATGGVASVQTLRHPIHAARIVMEQTPHVLLGGSAAEAFCSSEGAELAPRNYFSVQRRFEMLRKSMRKQGLTPPDAPLHGWPAGSAAQPQHAANEVGGTVGCVALDASGGLAAATSTGGRTAKMVGRIGDSPIPGAGNYANGSVAVGGTGKGEEYLRHFVTGRVAFLVESGAMRVDAACEHVLNNVLKPGDGGLIAVGRGGDISMRATTGAMPRGAADSSGRFEVAIWFD